MGVIHALLGLFDSYFLDAQRKEVDFADLLSKSVVYEQGTQFMAHESFEEIGTQIFPWASGFLNPPARAVNPIPRSSEQWHMCVVILPKSVAAYHQAAPRCQLQLV